MIVPRNNKKLVPILPERVRRLREHLGGVLREAKDPTAEARVRPEPSGFAAEVAHVACSLCRGWCCRNGGDDAFLDEPTLTRVRNAGSASDQASLLEVYVARVPAMGYEGSCIFHGKQGCTLDRSLRSDVCNAYFCGGLQAFLTGDAAAAPTVVIAGEGNRMHTSPVVMPKQQVP